MRNETPYEIGTKVFVRFKDKWHPGKVYAVQPCNDYGFGYAYAKSEFRQNRFGYWYSIKCTNDPSDMSRSGLYALEFRFWFSPGDVRIRKPKNQKEALVRMWRRLRALRTW